MAQKTCLLNAFYSFRLAKNTPPLKSASFQLTLIRQILSKYNAEHFTETKIPRRILPSSMNLLKVLPSRSVEHMPT